MRKQIFETLRLEKIVGGGQAIGTLDDGRKAFVWGGLPKELVTIRVTKKKSHFVEGIATEIIEKSPERITPKDENSYLSTSPWQIMPMPSEQSHKALLIEEAFLLHNITLPEKIKVFSDGVEFNYRNKVEFSWFGDKIDDEKETLDLAFFKRGGKGKVVVDGTSLAHPSINKLAIEIRDLLREKPIVARQLKTLLIRSDQQGNAVWQLYVKDKIENLISDDEAKLLSAAGGEIFQQCIFFVCEVNILSGSRHGLLLLVNLQIVNFQDVWLLNWWTTKQGSHARQQFINCKRLSQIIISAHV
jgi:23S rRNA (uracil1939-C5)-methyltransferase